MPTMFTCSIFALFLAFFGNMSMAQRTCASHDHYQDMLKTTKYLPSISSSWKPLPEHLLPMVAALRHPSLPLALKISVR